MKKIKKLINSLSIKRKIVFYSYIIIVPILIVICVFLTFDNYRQVKQSRFNSTINSIQSLSDSVEIIRNDVADFSTYIAINNQVIDILTAESPEELNKDSRLWVNEAPMKMVEDMMALKGYIKNIAIYPENGVSPYLRCIDSSSFITNIEEVRETQGYKEAFDKRGRSVWKHVDKGGEDAYAASRLKKIILCREIYDLSKKTPLGYLVIGISEEKINKLCENAVIDEWEGVIVLSSIGEELTRYGHIEEDIVSKIKQTDFSKLYKKNYDSFNFGDSEIFAYQNDSNNMIVCKIIPKINLWDMILNIAYMPLALLSGVLIGLLPVLLIVSNIVSKPLRNVCTAMGKFRKGDFTQQVEVNTNDEVGEVASCFNMLVTGIKQLIDDNYVMALKEKESELLALQAQINPHFLYNTLDSLYWQASDAGNEEIAENIYALSQLFRLVLGKGEGEITVNHEKELISRYLEIQKMRFSKQMNYYIDIDEEILNNEIPKLILQPFVENAVVHGIENSKEPCELKVIGRKFDDYMEFCIEDTGIGMTELQIKKILDENDNVRTSHQIGGYAIYNVRERLKLKYRDNFTLKIESSENIGTKVTLIIPIQAQFL